MTAEMINAHSVPQKLAIVRLQRGTVSPKSKPTNQTRKKKKIVQLFESACRDGFN